jgi:chromosome segregation ATPase
VGKEIAKKAAASAVETTVMSLLPSISETLGELRTEMKAVRAELRDFDGRIDNLEHTFTGQIADLRERTQEVINELSHRITRLDGRIEGFMEAVHMGLAGKTPQSRKRAS